MSTISSIPSSTLPQLFETNNTNNNSIRQVSGQQTPPLPPRGDGIMSAVQEALNQMGLSMDSSSTASGTESSSSTGGNDTAAASTVQMALYKFLHDLFTAMQDQSSATSSNTAYSPPMTTSIQDIIQALRRSSSTTSSNTSSSDAASPQTTDLSNLQSDFQSLVTVIGVNSTTGSSSTSLLTFLQNLENNLNQQGSFSINLVNTAA
jgi:hypothetical protein